MEWGVSGQQIDEGLVDDVLVHHEVNPLGSRILRGGGYSNFRGYVRSAYRESYTPDAGGIELAFGSAAPCRKSPSTESTLLVGRSASSVRLGVSEASVVARPSCCCSLITKIQCPCLRSSFINLRRAVAGAASLRFLIRPASLASHGMLRVWSDPLRDLLSITRQT